MTSMTFHGGVGEIGGNKILLQDESTSFFLDFGRSFSEHSLYYTEYLDPRKLALIDELTEFGLLPRVTGIYRTDYLQHTDEDHPLIGDEGNLDAVLISHAHLDHIGMIPWLRPETTLLGSKTTKQIMQYLQEVKRGDQSEYLEFCPSFEILPKKRGDGLKRGSRRYLKDEIRPREYEELSSKETCQIGDTDIETYPVDHSLPGADAFIIKTSNGNIGYTGDLRFHGYHGECTERFAKALEDTDIDLLLCEGTRADETRDLNEEELKEGLTNLLDDMDGLAIIDYSKRDSSRMTTIANASSKAGRTFLIFPEQAYYLHSLDEDVNTVKPDTDDYEILMPRQSWGIWGNPRFPEELWEQDYRYWATELKDFIFEQDNLITTDEVRKNQSQYVVTCGFYDLNILHDLDPEPGSEYIRSQSDPFDEEGMIDRRRLDNWLKHFGIGTAEQLHCSGHISGPEIKELLERAQPKRVVPIHTDVPEYFLDWHDNVELVSKGETVTL